MARTAVFAEAEPLYRRVLAIREEVLGPQHPDVTQSLENKRHYSGNSPVQTRQS